MWWAGPPDSLFRFLARGEAFNGSSRPIVSSTVVSATLTSTVVRFGSLLTLYAPGRRSEKASVGKHREYEYEGEGGLWVGEVLAEAEEAEEEEAAVAAALALALELALPLPLPLPPFAGAGAGAGGGLGLGTTTAMRFEAVTSAEQPSGHLNPRGLASRCDCAQGRQIEWRHGR